MFIFFYFQGSRGRLYAKPWLPFLAGYRGAERKSDGRILMKLSRLAELLELAILERLEKLAVL